MSALQPGSDLSLTVATMPDAMAEVNEVELLPDETQHKLLGATLERVNRASNAARAAAMNANAFEGTALRDVVRDEVERAKLPDGFVRPIADRVEASLRRRAGKQPKFSNFQMFEMPASGFKWKPGVTMLTASGRRTTPCALISSRL